MQSREKDQEKRDDILNNLNEDCSFDIKGFKNVLDWYFDAFENEERANKADEVIKELRGKYEIIGLGRNRIVFKLKSGNYVLKFPLGCSGEADNDWEGCVISNKHKDDERVKTPKTKWIKFKGFVCVVMEFITPTEKGYEELPEWCSYVDMKQVGYNKDGVLLAYDYGVR